MAFLKSTEQKNDTREFLEFDEAREVFKDSTKSTDERMEALDYILRHKEIYFVLKILSQMFQENSVEDHPLVDFAFSNFGTKPKREQDFDAMFEILQSNNAYLRNMAIKFLQEFGIEAKPFLEKLMSSEDKDIRIFAINILGDVSYDDSIDMLRYFVLKEQDINAMMTAVDYLGEVGSMEDVKLLEAIKEEHKEEPYVVFAIDTAIERIKG